MAQQNVTAFSIPYTTKMSKWSRCSLEPLGEDKGN